MQLVWHESILPTSMEELIVEIDKLSTHMSRNRACSLKVLVMLEISCHVETMILFSSYLYGAKPFRGS